MYFNKYGKDIKKLKATNTNYNNQKEINKLKLEMEVNK